MCGAVPLLPVYTFMAWTGTTVILYAPEVVRPADIVWPVETFGSWV